jgi:hypothetical protein
MRQLGRKRVRFWATLLLPLLLLRALVPVGFMPMVGADHSVTLVICDSYAPLPPMPMDMPMHAGMDHSGAPLVHQDHTGCIYGSSPALGALPMASLAPFVIEGSRPTLIASPQIGFYHTSPRAQSPRGPPVRLPTHV